MKTCLRNVNDTSVHNYEGNNNIICLVGSPYFVAKYSELVNLMECKIDEYLRSELQDNINKDHIKNYFKFLNINKLTQSYVENVEINNFEIPSIDFTNTSYKWIKERENFVSTLKNEYNKITTSDGTDLIIKFNQFDYSIDNDGSLIIDKINLLDSKTLYIPYGVKKIDFCKCEEEGFKFSDVNDLYISSTVCEDDISKLFMKCASLKQLNIDKRLLSKKIDIDTSILKLDSLIINNDILCNVCFKNVLDLKQLTLNFTSNNLDSSLTSQSATTINFSGFKIDNNNSNRIEKLYISYNNTCQLNFSKDVFKNIETKEIYIGILNRWFFINFENEFANPLCHGAKLFSDERLLFSKEKEKNISIAKKIKGKNVESKEISDIVDADQIKVTKIQDFAFYNCSSIKNVTISSNIEKIGKKAFFNKNNSIKEFILPKHSRWEAFFESYPNFENPNLDPEKIAKDISGVNSEYEWRRIKLTNRI